MRTKYFTKAKRITGREALEAKRDAALAAYQEQPPGQSDPALYARWHRACRALDNH